MVKNWISIKFKRKFSVAAYVENYFEKSENVSKKFSEILKKFE